MVAMKALQRITLFSILIVLGLVQSALGFFPGFQPSKLPAEYTFTETRGTVIDAETKKPIEGLIVVGMWELEWTGGPTYATMGTASKLIHVEEAVTDAEGKFILPAPPLIKRPKYWAFHGNDPEILFFKPGYKIEFLSNYFWLSSWSGDRGGYTYSKVRKSYWDGKVIVLEPFRIGRKIPIRDRYYTKERIIRYDTATPTMWEDDLGFIRGIFEMIEESVQKKVNGVPIELTPYIETQKVKNLVKVFAEERKKTSKPYYLELPKRFEDYLKKEIGHEN